MMNNKAYIPVVSDTQNKILGIWREILNNDNIGLDDSFFRLGGNSLLLVQFHARLDKLFPGKVTIPDLFANSTIIKLAKFIDNSLGTISSSQSIKALALPPEYFNNDFSNSGYLHFSFQVIGDLFIKLKTVTESEEFTLQDLLVAIFILMLAGLGREKIVEISTILDDSGLIKSINGDFRETGDMSSVLMKLIGQINNTTQQKTYTLRDVEKLVLLKDEESVFPVVMRKTSDILPEDLLGTFDIAFEIDVASSKVSFMLSFNADRLNEVKMEELVEEFLDLVLDIATQYAEKCK